MRNVSTDVQGLHERKIMTSYPDTPGFAAGSETSREAATRLTSKEELHSTILTYMGQMTVVTLNGQRYTVGGEQGLTGDEALVVCQEMLGRTFDRGTIAARFTELKAAGLIFETAGRRKSLRGRSSAVHVLKRYASTGREGGAGRVKRQSPKDAAMENLAQYLVGIVERNVDKQGYCSITIAPLDVITILNMAKTAGVA